MGNLGKHRRRGGEFCRKEGPSARQSNSKQAQNGGRAQKLVPTAKPGLYIDKLFERRLKMEKEKLHREFERKLSLARLSAPRPKCSVLKDYLANEKLSQSDPVNGVVTSSHNSTMQFLRPNDFCEFSSESEDLESDEEEMEKEPKDANQSDVIHPKLAVEEAKGEEIEAKNKALFSTTLASESNFCTSTPIKSQKSGDSFYMASPPFESEGKTDEVKCGQFFKWLQYFEDFENKLRREISTFENDQTKKEIRVEISRTIANRINDGAKKNSSGREMAFLFNFFDDLFGCRVVDSWREGSKFSLVHGDKLQQLFVMETICTRYLEHAKWDSELMEHILLVLVKLCKKSINFYKIFCAKLVDSVVLLSMDQDKIVSKIVGFGMGQPQEAASQWINNERVVFRLFCRVQFTLKSLLDKEPQKLQGFALIREMFTSVAEFPHPVILSSAFILAEVLQFARLFNKQNEELANALSERFLPSIKSKIVGKEWHEFVSNENMRKLDECARKALSARHDYLLDYLQESIRKLEP
uniref:Uncharacterized protein n=1 Tax=Globodera rostochiensis TaxID=31243 RepID=A0A914IB93_GLORO